MPAVLNIVFDLGGVLFEWNPEKILKAVYSDPRQRRQIMESVYLHADWTDLDRGNCSELQAITRIASRTQISMSELHQLVQSTRDSLKPMEESWALVDELHTQHIPLYVLSNMPSNTYRILQARYPRWHAFKGVLISAHVGLIKPESAIFEYLLAHFGLRAENTLLIDDCAANVLAARQAGMHAIAFTTVDDCRQQLQQLLRAH
jgi:putative hydrolase of the HAD superfamily